MHMQYYRSAKMNPNKTQDAELERFFPAADQSARRHEIELQPRHSRRVRTVDLTTWVVYQELSFER